MIHNQLIINYEKFIKPLVRFGESLRRTTPPWVSPTKIMGSLLLNAKLVSFWFYFTGFCSAILPCLSIFKSCTYTFSRVAVANTVY